MIESTEPSPRANDDGARTVPSAGELLKRARETTGMHIGTLAVTLKVPVKKLEALESDRWDLLPDAVFVRALAASVCRTLKVDPSEILESLPAATPRRMPNDAGINTPFRGVSAPGAAYSAASQLRRPLGLAVLALMLGALGLLLWPGFERAPGAPTADGPGGVPGNGSLSDKSAPAQDVRVENASASSPSGTPAGVAQNSDSAAATGLPPPNPVESKNPVLIPAESAGSGPELQGPSNPANVVFKTTGPSWIQVTDAKGAVVLKRLMGAGETATATGAPPLSILVGRVDATSVEIGGKPFDMSAIARENVARFEVKP